MGPAHPAPSLGSFLSALGLVIHMDQFYMSSESSELWLSFTWISVVLEKTLESPLDCKKVKQINPKGSQPWIFIGRTDVEAETPILWPPDVKNWLIGKDPDPGKDWRWEEKEMTEDETVGWHHRLDGHEFEQAPGVGEGQGRLACHSPWSLKELDMTEQLNWLTDWVISLPQSFSDLLRLIKPGLFTLLLSQC